LLMKNRSSRKAERPPSWGIVVRLDNGRHLYYCAASGRQGQADWGPRLTQATSFDSEVEAEKVAATFETNAEAKTYEVIRLGISAL
jgi:hypothetical protein